VPTSEIATSRKRSPPAGDQAISRTTGCARARSIRRSAGRGLAGGSVVWAENSRAIPCHVRTSCRGRASSRRPRRAGRVPACVPVGSTPLRSAKRHSAAQISSRPAVRATPGAIPAREPRSAPPGVAGPTTRIRATAGRRATRVRPTAPERAPTSRPQSSQAADDSARHFDTPGRLQMRERLQAASVRLPGDAPKRRAPRRSPGNRSRRASGARASGTS
jgi:hypothetical protein